MFSLREIIITVQDFKLDPVVHALGIRRILDDNNTSRTQFSMFETSAIKLTDQIVYRGCYI